MKRIIVVALVNFSLLWGQALPTDQIIYPNAHVLPAFNVNVQAGFIDIVGLHGWRPAARFGLGGVAEFEWTGVYFYSDLQSNPETIPTAGVKIRIPTFVPKMEAALALYNAQQWRNYRSNQARLAMDAGYTSAGLSSVNFESIYTRLDLLVEWSIMDKFQLRPSLYFLESKARNLNTVWIAPADGSQSSYTDLGIRKSRLMGVGLGFSLQVDQHLTYIGQWLGAPQYQLNVARQTLVLNRKQVFILGIRYRLSNTLVLDTGIYHDAAELNLSDIQVYGRVNVVLDITKIEPSAPK
ncbi:MAG: hypothetical protein IIB42_02950 [Candidatus Marinimicrobia bacterium]|nr:hypothetical protein [Candidatus Neomarinimicrobiota bacterium]